MTDDADVLIKINGIHLAQLPAAGNGLQDGHRHGDLDVTLDGTGYSLLDQHGEGRDQHGIQNAGLPLCKAVIVRGDEGDFLILYPLLKGNDVSGHVPHLLDGAAVLNVKGVQDVLRLCTDDFLICDAIRDGPHLLPVELLGIEPHAVVQVCLIDVQIHHAGVRTADLRQVRIAEAAAHLGRTAPVLKLCLHKGISSLYHACDHCVALTCALQIGHHLADCSARVQLAEPGRRVRVGIIGSLLFLYIYKNHRNIQVPDSRQHVVGCCIGQKLQNNKVHVCRAEFIPCCHRQLLRSDNAAVNHLNGVRQRLLERCILALELRNQRRELRQICSQGDGEHANAGLGFH